MSFRLIKSGERECAFQYFLTPLASAEGKNGGQFCTPSCAVRCLVEGEQFEQQV